MKPNKSVTRYLWNLIQFALSVILILIAFALFIGIFGFPFR